MLDKLKAMFSDSAEKTETSSETLHLAAAALLFEVSRSDNSICDDERQTMANTLATTFSLEASEVKSLLNDAQAESENATSVHPYTRLINDNFSAELKVKLIEALWRVAQADGNIDKYEENFIRKVSDLIYVPHSAYIKAKLLVINGG